MLCCLFATSLAGWCKHSLNPVVALVGLVCCITCVLVHVV